MARRSNRISRRSRQSGRTCLLQKAKSCLTDSSYDQDEADHMDAVTITMTPPPPPSTQCRLLKMARALSSQSASNSLSPSSPSSSLPSSATATNISPSNEENHWNQQLGITIAASPKSEWTAKAHAQAQSPFFSRFPIEVRRLIYEQLFRSKNPLMKMHIHAAHDSARLTTTPCYYAPTATYSTREDEVDPMQTDPWPGWRGRNQPPRWFWHAWGLRLRWGPHWKCQEAAMMDWNTRSDGTSVDLRGQKDGWTGAFLSCRQMYDEAIECFFESTALLFTASEDAFRFFVQNPHSHLFKIRDLNLIFNHYKDHLFLQRIDSKHPHLPNSASVPVAAELWLPLMQCIRERLPELRNLRIHLSPPSSSGQVFMDFLRDWERDGHGWAEEQAEGMIYLENGKSGSVLSKITT